MSAVRGRSFATRKCPLCGRKTAIRITDGRPWAHLLPHGRTRPDGSRMCPAGDKAAPPHQPK